MEKVIENNRFLVLDALRGIAAIGVFFFHIHSANFVIMDGLWLLVDFFFIPSGFVLYPQIRTISSNRDGLTFIRKRIIRLIPLPLLTIIFMIFRQHNDQLQEIKTIGVDSIQSYVGAILLLQVLSYQIVQVNLTLWSLSTEFYVNILSAFFHSTKVIISIILVSLLVLLYSIHYGYPKEIGILAISRTCLGFYVGMALRKLGGKLNKSKLRLIFCSILLIPMFSLGGRSIAAILLAIPIFAYIIIDCSKIANFNKNQILMRVCKWLGRNSFGIYVWQIPVNSIIQSKDILSLSHLNSNSVFSQAVVVICKLGILLIFSELSTRFYEEPIRKVLGGQNHK